MTPASRATIDSPVETALLVALAPVQPPPDATARILRRRLAATGGGPAVPALVTIRGDAGTWDAYAPGIERKVLLDQSDTFAFLLRLQAGAQIPAHGHDAHEECLVLEGTVRIADQTVWAGDFHFAPRGVRHTPIVAVTAALLYLRTAA